MLRIDTIYEGLVVRPEGIADDEIHRSIEEYEHR